MSTEASERNGRVVRLWDRLGAGLRLGKGQDDVEQPVYASSGDGVHLERVASGEPLIPQIRKFSRGTTRLLWLVPICDMAAAAWMISAGSWFDQTSRLTSVVTLGGHHTLVLVMALVGFVMLAGLALPTKGFTVKRNEALLTIACFVSIASLAGALSVILPVAIVVFLLFFRGLFKG